MTSGVTRRWLPAFFASTIGCYGGASGPPDPREDGTPVLVVDGEVRIVSPAAPSVFFAREAPAFWLYYREPLERLPVRLQDRVDGEGRRVPLPDRFFRIDAEHSESVAVPATDFVTWRLSNENAGAGCQLRARSATAARTASIAVAWDESTVITADAVAGGGVELVGQETPARELHLAREEIFELAQVSNHRALASSDARSVFFIDDESFTRSSTPSLVRTQIKSLASPATTRTGTAVFALGADGSVLSIDAALRWHPTPKIDAEPVSRVETIFSTGDDFVLRYDDKRRLFHHGRLVPQPGGNAVSEITTVANIPEVGLIAAGTATVEDVSVAILLRYDETAADDEDPWRWYAILDGHRRISALAAHQGGVLFASDAGWGHYAPLTGLCTGESDIAPATALVGLQDGSFFIAGTRRGHAEPMRGWLLPR